MGIVRTMKVHDRGVDGEPGGEQTILQETADAMEQTWRAFAAPNPGENAKP
jgi:hypothetical protein